MMSDANNKLLTSERMDLPFIFFPNLATHLLDKIRCFVVVTDFEGCDTSGKLFQGMLNINKRINFLSEHLISHKINCQI